MNKKWKKTGRLFMASMAAGAIIIASQAGHKVQAAESETKKVVSISYKPDKPITINEGDDECGFWLKTKKGEFFKYSIDTIVGKTSEGDKLIIKYSDNTEKELVLKIRNKMTTYYDHLEELGMIGFGKTEVFVNPNSMASEYDYFYDGTKYQQLSEASNIKEYYDYSLEGNYGEVFAFSDEEDDVIFFDELEFEGKQTFDKRWTGGKTYNVSVKYAGKKSTVPIKIIENGIKRISYTPAKKIKLKAETDGSWQDGHNGHCTLWRTDSEYPEYYEYDISPYFYKKGSKITVTYNDNSKKVYTYKNKAFRDKNGKRMPYDVSYQDKQTYKTRWKTGKTYKINLYYANKKTTFPVKIVKDNSIAGIEFVPESGKIFKCEKNEYTERVNAGEYLYNKGNKLIIKYKNGKKKTYKCTEGEYYWGTFKDSKGKKFSCMDIGCKTNQDKQPWEIGKTYKAKIKCLGMRTTISVKVVESKE